MTHGRDRNAGPCGEAVPAGGEPDSVAGDPASNPSGEAPVSLRVKLNPLLTAAAVAYALSGLALTFVPEELLRALGGGATRPGVWLAQLVGAALLGLAWLNWLQRHATVGGVLGRPVLLTNLLFASMSFWATLHAWRQEPTLTGLAWIAGVLGLLGVAFGARLFRAPAPAR